jgi:hypothetical protein
MVWTDVGPWRRWVKGEVRMSSTVHARTWKTFSLAIALLLSMGILPGLISTHRAAAQADGISQSDFDDLVDEATADDPVYGPEEGDLDLDPDRVTFSTADVTPADFYAEATFQNPYASSTGQFDYGIQFRSGDQNFLRFIVVSDGTWGITDGTQDVLASDTYDNVDDSRQGQNTLAVYADGDTIHVAINGDYVGSAQTDNTDEGRISVGTSFLPDSIVEGETTSFTDFNVWELGGGGLGPSKTKTPTSSKRTPTPQDVEGTLYESPTYGYTLTYDDTWDVVSDDSNRGEDDFRISDGTSSMQFLGYEFDGSPDDCISDTLDELQSDPDMDNPEVAVDNDDNELQGTLDDGSAFVVVNVTYQDSDLTVYYQCTTIVDGESMLKVTQLANADDYNDEIEARAKVLETISPDGSDASGNDRETPDDQPTDDINTDETPEADGTSSDLPPGSVVVYMEASEQDGPVVLASLIPDGRKTQVEVFVLASDSSVTYDASFNEGTCNRPGDVAFDAGQSDNLGMIDAEVDETVENLSSGDYVMVLTDDATGDVVACGDPSEFVE